MAVRSRRDIYALLEKHLRATAYPLTVNALMDISEIRNETLKEFTNGDTNKDNITKATNKLSDILGFMWRRNLLTRYPAPKESNSLARYAYVWEPQEDSHPITEEPLAKAPSGKTGVIVTEVAGGVFIEFQRFTVLIKPRE